jgi:tetrahydromethanopterin S-methyltransferase subunit F
VAHGRLAKADPGGGTRDTALGEQRVESDEQVQVDAAQIDVVDVHYRSDLFDR